LLLLLQFQLMQLLNSLQHRQQSSHGVHCRHNLNVGKHMVNAATILGVSQTVERRRLSVAGKQGDG
jgi:hypothetical protein